MTKATELELLKAALATLDEGFTNLPGYAEDFDAAAAADVLQTVAHRMQDNYPYFHPQYAGQMLKPPHPVARLAYALSLWINPNNHALDGGRASSAMEKECIVQLGEMFGWERPLGHLAGGGTMANLEALWVAGRLHPGKRIVASEMAHYTHSRISEVLGLPFTAVPVDGDARMDLAAVEALLQEGNVGTVVATMGNTGFGAVDPLADLIQLQSTYDFRIHADAAYGGYFTLAKSVARQTQEHFSSLADVDSIVVDPHKHGLQPYGCGCVLFKDPGVGQLYEHGSPYTYFTSGDMHLGEITLECSRPGAAAVALWATHQLLPPVTDGKFASGLDDCLLAARDFYNRLRRSKHFLPLLQPELDIVVYSVAAPDTTTASENARRLFDRAAQHDLHLALVEVPVSLALPHLPDTASNSETITCLRSVLMKPEHREWCQRIVTLLEASAEEIVSDSKDA
jgi:glutamate/tyrosine decarboxylase-like PLP-dependent enzyme